MRITGTDYGNSGIIADFELKPGKTRRGTPAMCRVGRSLIQRSKWAPCSFFRLLCTGRACSPKPGKAPVFDSVGSKHFFQSRARQGYNLAFSRPLASYDEQIWFSPTCNIFQTGLNSSLALFMKGQLGFHLVYQLPGAFRNDFNQIFMLFPQGKIFTRYIEGGQQQDRSLAYPRRMLDYLILYLVYLALKIVGYRPRFG